MADNQPQELQKDLYLRVKEGSELASMIRYFQDPNNGPVSFEELRDIGGMKRSPALLTWLKPNVDNLLVKRSRGDGLYDVRFIEVGHRASTIVNVESANIAGGAGSVAGDASELGVHIIWPETPKIPDPAEYMRDPKTGETHKFRKPSWFSGMQAMVKAGRHISMESPPGVGKDTAVLQLAHEEQQPLAILNGDGGIRRRDIMGYSEMVNGTSFYNVALVAAAAINGWWCLVTEINMAEQNVYPTLNGWIAPPKTIEFRGKMYPVHPNFRLFITYNAGLAGTKPIQPAFKDRFFPLKLDFLSDVELRTRLEDLGMPDVDEPDNVVSVSHNFGKEQKVYKVDWPAKVIEFARSMWDTHKQGQMIYQITIRRLADAVELMNSGATSGNAKTALRMAVVDAIDQYHDRSKAGKLLNGIFQTDS